MSSQRLRQKNSSDTRVHPMGAALDHARMRLEQVSVVNKNTEPWPELHPSMWNANHLMFRLINDDLFRRRGLGVSGIICFEVHYEITSQVSRGLRRTPCFAFDHLLLFSVY